MQSRDRHPPALTVAHLLGDFGIGTLGLQEIELSVQGALHEDLRVHDAAVGAGGDADADKVVV